MKHDTTDGERIDGRTDQHPLGRWIERTARGGHPPENGRDLDGRAFLVAAPFLLAGSFGGLFGRVSVLRVDIGTVVGFVGLVGFGIAGLYFGSKGYDRYRAMADIEPTAVAALTPGIREVTGTVVSAGETLRSPLDDTECVAYSHSGERFDEDEGDGILDWLLWRFLGGVQADQTASAPFYVEDGSGRVFVDGAKANLALKTDERRTNTMDGIEHTADSEGVLEAGDPVYVFGEAMRELPEPSLGDGAFGNAVRAVGDAIPVDEATKNEFVETVRESAADRPGPRDDEFVIGDGESGYGLFVSDGSERAGGRRQLLRVAMFGGGGVFLLVLAAYAVVSSVL